MPNASNLALKHCHHAFGASAKPYTVLTASTKAPSGTFGTPPGGSSMNKRPRLGSNASPRKKAPSTSAMFNVHFFPAINCMATAKPSMVNVGALVSSSNKSGPRYPRMHHLAFRSLVAGLWNLHQPQSRQIVTSIFSSCPSADAMPQHPFQPCTLMAPLSVNLVHSFVLARFKPSLL